VKVLLMKSPDGVRWSTPVEVLSEEPDSGLLSPAALHDGNCFWMWTGEVQDGELKLMRRHVEPTATKA